MEPTSRCTVEKGCDAPLATEPSPCPTVEKGWDPPRPTKSITASHHRDRLGFIGSHQTGFSPCAEQAGIDQFALSGIWFYGETMPSVAPDVLRPGVGNSDDIPKHAVEANCAASNCCGRM